MLKPDFGDVFRIQWNSERIAWVRYLAEDLKMTAREIALDIGLAANQAPRIFELCKRCKIELPGNGRPRSAGDARVYSVAIVGTHAPLLARLAKRHQLQPGRLAEMLLSAVFETGEPFCENLLDLEAGQ